MSTPFDKVAADIMRRGYHNHRLEEHSDTICRGVLRDLLAICKTLRLDFDNEVVRAWSDVPAPGDRGRRIDLLVAEPESTTNEPGLTKTRLGIENKSVVTAHRNKTNRQDDRIKLKDAFQYNRPETVLVATIIVGTSQRYLNISDRVKPFYDDIFEDHILPRLSSGDLTLWDELPKGISHNKPHHPAQTIDFFRAKLPIRPLSMTHQQGYDYVLLVPMHIDNVTEPYVDREFAEDINHDADYAEMIESICKAYTARWHMR